jgi:hypothetical protein
MAPGGVLVWSWGLGADRKESVPSTSQHLSTCLRKKGYWLLVPLLLSALTLNPDAYRETPSKSTCSEFTNTTSLGISPTPNGTAVIIQE